jgi:hypothetical protein
MITWYPVSKLAKPGTEIWVMDGDYSISLAVFNGVDKYIHQSGEKFDGIKWWTHKKEINLPE